LREIELNVVETEFETLEMLDRGSNEDKGVERAGSFGKEE
jgi:hypothetical protein